MAVPCCPVLAVKVSLVGSISVGKTSLAQRLCRGTTSDNNKPTIAGDWFHSSVRVGKTRVNLQVWDTAGQERFRSVIPSYIRASAAAIIVYDVTDARSFSERVTWLRMVRSVVPTAMVILVGNKVDKPNRVITSQQGELFAQTNDLSYMETSAVTGHNVEELFHRIAEHVMSSEDQQPDQNNISLGKSTHTDTHQHSKKCSC